VDALCVLARVELGREGVEGVRESPAPATLLDALAVEDGTAQTGTIVAGSSVVWRLEGDLGLQNTALLQKRPDTTCIIPDCLPIFECIKTDDIHTRIFSGLLDSARFEASRSYRTHSASFFSKLLPSLSSSQSFIF